MSSIHARALAIAASRASRVSGLIVGFADGLWMMPLTAAKVGAAHASTMDRVRLNEVGQTKQAWPKPSHPHQQRPVAPVQLQTMWGTP
jgi:hypothetical protein